MTQSSLVPDKCRVQNLYSQIISVRQSAAGRLARFGSLTLTSLLLCPVAVQDHLSLESFNGSWLDCCQIQVKSDKTNVYSLLKQITVLNVQLSFSGLQNTRGGDYVSDI